MGETITRWIWDILSVFGWHLPEDLPPYWDYIRMEWYYRAVPGIFVAVVLFSIIGLFYLAFDWTPRLKKYLREQKRKELGRKKS
jgi:hypothetical protein